MHVLVCFVVTGALAGNYMMQREMGDEQVLMKLVGVC